MLFSRTIFLTLWFCILLSPGVNSQGISNNGEYVYSLSNNLLILQSTKHTWKKELQNAKLFPGSSSSSFSTNSKYFFYLSGDTLYRMKLGSEEKTFMRGIAQDWQSFKTPKNHGPWLTCRLKNGGKSLLLINTEKWQQIIFDNISEYDFEDNGKYLIAKSAVTNTNPTPETLDLIDLGNLTRITIWSDQVSKVIRYSINTTGNQIAIITQYNKVKKITRSIWIYDAANKNSVLLAADTFPGIPNGLKIASNKLEFSREGNKIYLNLEEIIPIINPAFPKVDVWSYTDPVIQSKQLPIQQARNYAAAISIADKNLIQIELENEFLLGTRTSSNHITIPQVNDSFALVSHFKGDISQGEEGIQPYMMSSMNWNSATESDVYIVTLKNGSRKKIRENIKVTSPCFPHFWLSPTNRYVIYYDQQSKNYYSYNIRTEKTVILTNQVLSNWPLSNSKTKYYINNYYDLPYIDLICWTKDNSFFVFDGYWDIWKLDATGENKPVKITNKRDITCSFRWTYNFLPGQVVTNEQKIYLQYSTGLKNGVSSLSVNGGLKDIIPADFVKYDFVKTPLEGDELLIGIQSAIEPSSVNYYTPSRGLTRVISDSARPKRIGYKKELMTWTTFDGTISKGLLYKPVNFDPKRKYPVLFHYYESPVSAIFNKFDEIGKFPIILLDVLNPEPYLNDGYLIFVPDIQYKIGNPGRSAYNSVVSAAIHLSKLIYVDGSKMGLVGHSFGGYETNYIITHSKLFAAAFSSSGISDLISFWGNGEGSQMSDGGQFQIGVTLWDRPDIFLKNSPIFFADRVTTPVVLVANKSDGTVPWAQGIEFFKALRQLGKKVWMLQYDGETHANPPDANIRQKQFFDHYLKTAPAPVWMTKGIPAKLKGTTSGLEFDSSMKTPGEGLLMKNENALTPQQRNLLMHKTTIDKEGRIISLPQKIKK